MHPAKKKRYDCLGPRVAEALKKRNFNAFYCSTREEVLPLLLSLIPKGDVVSWGGSATLAELNIPKAVEAAGYAVIDRAVAKTPEEKTELLRKALLCDTFLTSTNALGADGTLVNIDGVGNRVAAMTYGPRRVFVVAGMNKVVADREEAHRRARTEAAPMVVQRFPERVTPCIQYGSCHNCQSDDCICSYIVETRMSHPKGRITVILVGDDFGL